MRDDDYTPPDAEGSSAAQRILLLLHRHPAGMPYAEITTLTGLDELAVRHALLGLLQRSRVVTSGHGKAARWQSIHHARQAARA
jgi:hypothetical protein